MNKPVTWQGIKDDYDTLARSQLEVIQKFFSSETQPSSITDMEALAAADTQFTSAVQSLYNALPQSAQRARSVGSRQHSHV